MMGFKDYVDCFYRELGLAVLLWSLYIAGLFGILALVLTYGKPLTIKQIAAISVPFVMIAYLHLQLIYYRYVTLGLIRRELSRLVNAEGIENSNLERWISKGLYVARARSVLSLHLGIDIVILGVIASQPLWTSSLIQ